MSGVLSDVGSTLVNPLTIYSASGDKNTSKESCVVVGDDGFPAGLHAVLLTLRLILARILLEGVRQDALIMR